MGAEKALTSALGKFYAVAEAYPELKANETIAQLMEELTSTENKVAFSRQAYNDAVMNFNTTKESFPNNFVASTFGFGKAELFEIDNEEHKEAPKIKF